ncbi:MAG: prepilin peptidase [Candidatus Omnitrophica bacterium]|nr:prepilin peptidase [Candidatus Omnitrophota bacterium]
MNCVIDVFVFVFGLIAGSFLNVCIHRIPRGESIILPDSHCPHCGKGIAWYDNIPVLSYLLLVGKCRLCRQKISWRYPFVELMAAVMVWGMWTRYGLSPFFFAGSILFLFLLGVFFTDFETGYIPDKFSITGMVLGLVLSSLFPELHQKEIWYGGLLNSSLGLLLGGGLLFLTAVVGNLVFHKESMGGGDVKLLAMIGAFLGFKKTLFVFFFAPILAVPFGLYVKFIKKGETIPFGPFIAVAGGWLFLYGDQMIRHYFLF